MKAPGLRLGPSSVVALVLRGDYYFSRKFALMLEPSSVFMVTV
jgi:hypothetical protein